MNDLQIMQGLECCACIAGGCVCCPYIDMLTDEKGCISTLIEDALQLIERLKKEAGDIDNFLRSLCEERLLNGNRVATFEDLQSYMNKQKSEAIKEFAEKLKATFPDRQDSRCTLDDCYTLDIIDNIVKETIGGAEE